MTTQQHLLALQCLASHAASHMDSRGEAAAVRAGCKRCRFSASGCDRCRIVLVAPSASRAGDDHHRAGGKGSKGVSAEDAASHAIGSDDTGDAGGGGGCSVGDGGKTASSALGETERGGGRDDKAGGPGARESGREQHGGQGGAEADGDCGQCINCLDKPKVSPVRFAARVEFALHSYQPPYRGRAALARAQLIARTHSF